jgi:PhzF family phenazine biosynthesis protein
MNEFDIYQVDAFTDHLFGGNPAAVIPLKEWLPKQTMQNIAMENNLSETVFFIPTASTSDFHIRWFTPTIEVSLCGHATLATAHVLWKHLDFPNGVISFDSKSGVLKVEKKENVYTLDFPADNFREVEKDMDIVANALKIKPLYLYRGKDDYMAILSGRREIQELEPNFAALKNLNARGLIATAACFDGDEDFVSRCFFPEAGIEEDPVTGSAHTLMTPFWADKMDKNILKAQQLSKRKGHLICELKGDRVLISGEAKTYMIGKILMD